MQEDLYFLASLLGHMIAVSVATLTAAWFFFLIKDRLIKTLNYKIIIEKKDLKINWIKDGF